MIDYYNSVKDFHKAFNQLVANEPSLPDQKTRDLRKKLLTEEYNEYIMGEDANDLENIAKELADIIYIACGTAVSYGIDLNKVFAEVHRSNMDKLIDGKVHYREDGKVLKPESWSPPNIKQFIEKA
jgi:predicted HAD superfamily Cof-like phosphohydrolase